MNWVEQIVTALFKWLQGMAQSDTRSEDAKTQPKLREDLLSRIDEHERRVRKPGDPGATR